jgi:hypothetical protein
MKFYWIQSSTEENSQSEKKNSGIPFYIKPEEGKAVKIRPVINIQAAVTVTNLTTNLHVPDMN